MEKLLTVGYIAKMIGWSTPRTRRALQRLGVLRLRGNRYVTTMKQLAAFPEVVDILEDAAEMDEEY